MCVRAYVYVCMYECAYVCARTYVVRECACEEIVDAFTWCPSSPRESQPLKLFVHLGGLEGQFGRLSRLSPFILIFIYLT
jgi:hypothetical protein